MTDSATPAIRHDQTASGGAFVIERDGRRLAEQTYRRVDDRHVVIEHTEVSAELQGQGIARKLLDATVGWARDTGTRVAATCSYATAQFKKDASLRDVLDE